MLISQNLGGTCSWIVHMSVLLWLWFRKFLGSPAEVGENWDIQRGTQCWQWQIAEASRASSIMPCGYTMWLPPPQETWSAFHLCKTGVTNGTDKDFRSILCCYPNVKEGLDMLSVLVFSAYLETNNSCHSPSICRGGKSTRKREVKS